MQLKVLECTVFELKNQASQIVVALSIELCIIHL